MVSKTERKRIEQNKRQLEPRLMLCPICNGDGSIWLPGSGRIKCPGCEGCGKVYDLGPANADKNAEKDRATFQRMKGNR